MNHWAESIDTHKATKIVRRYFPQDADDLIQSAILELYAKPDVSLNLLVTVARRRGLNMLRNNRSNKMDPITDTRSRPDLDRLVYRQTAVKILSSCDLAMRAKLNSPDRRIRSRARIALRRMIHSA